jgi:uncharacterized membrane protein
MPENTVSDEKLKSALAYLGWWLTGIIFLLIEKKNKTIRFHAMQSTIVFGAISLVSIVLGIIPFIGWMMSLIVVPILWLGSFILWLLLMWKAYNGEKYLLPYVGEIAEKQLEKMK